MKTVRKDKGQEHKKQPNRKSSSPNGRYSGLLKNRTVMKTQNPRCSICGSTDNLDAHHIDCLGPHLNTQPNNVSKNLIILCHSCHIQLHSDLIAKRGFWQRDQDIRTRRANGETLQSIADSYHISRQRVFQLLDKPAKMVVKPLDKPLNLC